MTAIPTTAPAASESGTFRSLRIRNFRLFFAAQLISQSGTWVTRIALTLLILDLTDGSGLAVGVLAVCQYGPVLLLAPWAGTVADRVDKRRLLIAVQTLETLHLIVLGLLVAVGTESVVAIGVLALAHGVLAAIENPTRWSFVTDLVPEAEASNAIGLNTSAITGARIVGPALAGAVVVTAGYAWCFFIDAGSFVLAVAALLLMRPADLNAPPRIGRARGQVREGLRYVAATRALRTPLVMMTIVGLFALNLTITVPLLVRETLHGSELTFSIVFSGLSIGSVVGALIASRTKVVADRHIVVAAVAFGLSLSALAVTPNLALAFLLAGPVGVTSSWFLTLASTASQVRADPTFRGRVVAVHAILIVGTTPIGGPILGLVADHFGARTSVLVGAVACFAAAAYGSSAARPALVRSSGG